MNNLVKQIVDDDGQRISKEDQQWHVVGVIAGEPTVLCSGEFVSEGADSGNGSEYIFRQVERGGVTCKRCLEIVREFKGIKL